MAEHPEQEKIDRLLALNIARDANRCQRCGSCRTELEVGAVWLVCRGCGNSDVIEPSKTIHRS